MGATPLQAFLDSKFAGAKTRRLGGLYLPLKRNRTIPRGTLVIVASGDTQLRVKILEKDTPHRGRSTPLILTEECASIGISPNYLHWYFAYADVQDWLMDRATGSVILRIPTKSLDALPVPVPRHPAKRARVGEIVLKRKEDSFRRLIDGLYDDYRLNMDHRRYRTAVILAGAMSEAILSQLLLDQDVDKKLIENDASLGLGRLITYVRLLRLDEELSVPVTHLTELQKKRNRAVHTGPKKLDHKEFKRADLNCFDQIVKHFGI